MLLCHRQLHGRQPSPWWECSRGESSQGRRELPLALVPLLFGIQQLTEGIVWVSLSNDLPLVQSWATYIYSMFSHVVWPIVVPLAILLVEPRIWRRRAITVFVGVLRTRLLSSCGVAMWVRSRFAEG